MHIPNTNNLEIVKDNATITITIIYEIINKFSVGLFTFDVDQF